MWQATLILVLVQLALVALVAFLPDRLPAALMLLPNLRPAEQPPARRSRARRPAARRRAPTRPKAKKRPKKKAKKKASSRR